MMCEYWHRKEVYEVQFGIYISSYEVYRTGKHCNIDRICTPMVYIPANTAELSCPLQVIQRIILYPKLHFTIFSHMMSAFAHFILCIFNTTPRTVPHRFSPLLQAYPVRQGAYAFPVRALWPSETVMNTDNKSMLEKESTEAKTKVCQKHFAKTCTAQGGGYCKTLCDLKRT